MAQPEAKRLNPFLRDAAISFVPQLTDDQLVRITRAITALNPGTLVSRMTDFTAMIQGFPVEAETAHEANRVTWAIISREVRDVLVTAVDAHTELTSIDVRLPEESLFDLH
jgi:hypothetical protein